MDETVSVIIPVYKVEMYLERCVESVRNQTYGNLEIILVDDGSPDSCPIICDEYGRKDNRIKVIHKDNGGLSDARNVGVSASSGEYICFIDSDDYIEITMIERLKAAIDKYRTSMSVCNFKCQNETGDRTINIEDSPIKDERLNAVELIPRIYRPYGWYYIVAWNKLYSRDLVLRNPFPIGKLHEDEFICAQMYEQAGEIACISSEEYIYINQRKGSIMASKNVKSQIDWLEALYLRFCYVYGKPEYALLAKETRAIYFRELNNLFLSEQFKGRVSKQDKNRMKKYYSMMNDKTRNEKVTWVLFNISPLLEYKIVEWYRGAGLLNK